MRFTAAWVYAAMATAGVSLLEKQRQYAEACDIIRQLLGARSGSQDLPLCPSFPQNAPLSFVDPPTVWGVDPGHFANVESACRPFVNCKL
jgi:hypothetical protein